MPHPRLSLATRILALQVGTLLAAVALGAAAAVSLVRNELDQQYEQRSLAIAQSVAAVPAVGEALRGPDPSAALQPLAEKIREASGATFIVITDRAGIRYSHPNPDLIGKKIDEDPTAALEGRPWVGIEQGTLGVSARGKAPIRDAAGSVIGIVSVGFLEEQITAQLATDLPQLGGSLLLILAIGVGGSLLLARRLKRQTFGLEPSEIAALFEQREAMLHGIREGVVATDRDGRITLVNDEARRLLGLDGSAQGRRLDEVVPLGRMRDVLAGRATGIDQMLLAEDRVLVANRMPAVVRGETVGAVVTLRDRTELEGVLRELDGVRSLAHALRAQTHEFSNKLHTVSGLLELGRYDDASRFIARTASVHQELVDLVHERIDEPALAALLLAKAAIASERGVDFRLAGETRLPADAADERDLVTVVGNLVDNAVEAASGPDGSGWVEVAVQAGPDGVGIRVRDSGPGVADDVAEHIFSEGFTTKPGTSHQGLGLALVRRVAQRRGGWVRVTNEGGTVFTALLTPAEVAAT